jgi:hypothetical protein
VYDVYHALARELGLRLEPADPGMMTFVFDLSGELDGRPVKLTRFCGKGARMEITSPIVPHLDLGLGQLDEPEFDKAFGILGDEPDRVRALLCPEVRQAMGQCNAPELEISDGMHVPRWGWGGVREQ